MTVKMILATDSFFGIGKDGSIPWNCPEDMQYFKEQTLNQTVIMGRKTFDSLPHKGGLPDRQQIVITQAAKFVDGRTKIVYSYLEDWKQYLSMVQDLQWEGFWVIGGTFIYNQLLPYVDEIHHTMIDGDYNCDTFFNMDFLEDWKLVEGKDLADNAVLNIWRRK